MLGKEALERDLEPGLPEFLRKFLMEVGVGFAFVGNQYLLALTVDRVPRRPAFLPSQAALLCGYRFKAVPFQPEFAGNNGLLPVRG